MASSSSASASTSILPVLISSARASHRASSKHLSQRLPLLMGRTPALFNLNFVSTRFSLGLQRAYVTCCQPTVYSTAYELHCFDESCKKGPEKFLAFHVVGHFLIFSDGPRLGYGCYPAFSRCLIANRLEAEESEKHGSHAWGSTTPNKQKQSTGHGGLR